MNQFETVENVDAYNELANAVVVLACDDYRDYKKHFRKNEDVLAYINQMLGEVKKNTEQHYNLKMVKEDTEFEQKQLQSKIAEIENFLPSPYGMMLSHGLGDVILEKNSKRTANRRTVRRAWQDIIQEKRKEDSETSQETFGKG